MSFILFHETACRGLKVFNLNLEQKLGQVGVPHDWQGASAESLSAESPSGDLVPLCP